MVNLRHKKKKSFRERIYKIAYWWARKDLHANPANAREIALAAIEHID